MKWARKLDPDLEHSHLGSKKKLMGANGINV